MHYRSIAGEIIERRNMTLYQHASIGGQQNFFPFEKEIVWLANSKTRLEFWHGGEFLKQGPTYNDFYGYFTSLKFDGDHLKNAEHFKIDEKSTLELRLITTIELTPHYESEEFFIWNKDAIERKMKFKLYSIPAEYNIPFQYSDGKINTTHYKGLAPINAIEQVTWSSKNSQEVNGKIADEFITKWKSNDEAKYFFSNCISQHIDGRENTCEA